MFGQGRPHHAVRRFTPAGAPYLREGIRARLALCALILIFPQTLCRGETMRLRVTWGQGQPQRWKGELTGPAAFRQMRVLGMQPDSLWSLQSSPTGVRIEAASPRVFDGFDIEVEAPLDTPLAMVLGSPPQSAANVNPSDLSGVSLPKKLEFRLSELVQQGGFVAAPLDDTGNRLHITRTPGDELHVSAPEGRTVFAPGQEVMLEATPRVYRGTAPHNITRRIKLLNSQGKQIWSRDVEKGENGGNGKWIVRFQTPNEQGVFELRLELWQRNASIALRAIPERLYVQRAIRFVVVARDPTISETQGDATWQLVSEFQPAVRSSLLSLSRTGALRNASEPMHRGELSRVDDPVLGPLSRLIPDEALRQSTDASAWMAFPVNFSKLGEAYALLVDYPTDRDLAMGISFLEKDPSRGWRSVGQDEGIRVDPTPGARTTPQLLTHEMVVWPRFREGLLLITAPSSKAPALFGSVKVKRLAPRSISGLPLMPNRSTSGPERLPLFPGAVPAERSARENTNDFAQRGVATWLTRGSFLSRYTAPYYSEPSSMLRRGGGESSEFDDWQKVYTAVDRWMQASQYAGYNTLFVNVLADGASLLPENLCRSTPKWETGLFLPQGFDPSRKDVLELILSMADRDGAAVVPCLQLAAPLESLEAVGSGKRGQWAWTDGRRMPANSTQRGDYSPLHEEVQQAQLQLLTKIVDRYARHPSFAGLCIQLSARDSVHLRNLDWGYDDATMAEFFKVYGEMPAEFPQSGAQRFIQRRQLMAGPKAEAKLKAAWQAWRTNRIQTLYEKMAEIVGSARGGAKLYLSPHELLLSDAYLTRLRPEPDAPLRVDQIFTELGLEAKFLADHPQLVLLRPDFAAPSGSALAGAAAELAGARELDAMIPQGEAGASSRWHASSTVLVEELGAEEANAAPIQFALEWKNRGASSCQYLAEALARKDQFLLGEGGLQGASLSDAASRQFLKVYRELPNVRFENAPLPAQPVVLRGASLGNVHYCYLLNPSPWPLRYTLFVDDMLSAPDGLTEECPAGVWAKDGGRSSWKLELPPFALYAYRMGSIQPAWREARVEFPQEAAAALHPAVHAIWKKASSTVMPRNVLGLKNADFEIADNETGMPLHWTASPRNAARLDSPASAGKNCLHMQTDGMSAHVFSERFAPPLSGRLNLTVNIKARVPADGLKLGIILEDAATGVMWAEWLGVGTRYPIEKDWKSYQLPVMGLPVSDERRLRVRLQLSGTGEIWVDDVQLHDPRFSSSAESERMALASVTKGLNDAELQISAGRPDLAWRYLESYWPRYLRDQIADSGEIAQAEVKSDILVDAPAPLSDEQKVQSANPSLSSRWRSLWNWY